MLIVVRVDTKMSYLCIAGVVQFYQQLQKELLCTRWLCGPVAQRIRHLTTNQGIPGSNPGRVDFFFPFFSHKR